MHSVTTYPYKGKMINKQKLIGFIAAIVYLNEAPTSSKNRVRSKLAYELGKALKDTPRFNAAEIFSWAITQKTWSALSHVQGLPLLPQKISMDGIASGEVGTPICLSIPTDYAPLKKLYIDTYEKLIEANQMIEQLRQHISTLEADKKYLETKKAEQIEKNTESGKKKKGVKHEKH